jgi:stromal membrane-associated protein
MSRRPPPNPAAERAAQNLITIKSLLKLEANKICADCKKNKRENPLLPRPPP